MTDLLGLLWILTTDGLRDAGLGPNRGRISEIRTILLDISLFYWKPLPLQCDISAPKSVWLSVRKVKIHMEVDNLKVWEKETEFNI